MDVRKIWSYFNNAIAGSVVFIILLWIEFFAWLRNPTDSIPAWYFYVAQLIMIVIVCVIYAYLRHQYDTGRFSSAIQVRYVDTISTGDGWILIVKNTPTLEINRVVSICYQSKDNDIEETIAIGYVETKNNLGNFQIKVLKEDLIKECDLEDLGYKLVRVKPVVDKAFLP